MTIEIIRNEKGAASGFPVPDEGPPLLHDHGTARSGEAGYGRMSIGQMVAGGSRYPTRRSDHVTVTANRDAVTASASGIHVLLLATMTLLLVGCAETTGSPSSSAEDQRYSVTTTVLESAEHGPQLCLGGVAESYPPQCGGPDVVGWDWVAVDGENAAAGTTWGEYTVTGTWDGERLTLTEPPAGPEPADHPPAGDAFTTPCDPPADGWAVIDPSTATQEDMHSAIESARSQPAHAGVWLDQLTPSEEPAREEPLNSADAVLNMRVAEDLERLEREVRELWGGPLCITRAERTLDELVAIQQELQEVLDDILGSSIDEVQGIVEIMVPVANEDLRNRLDERYPGNVVEVHGRLQPVS